MHPALQTREQAPELVAAEPADDVGGAHRARQPHRDDAQQFVAGLLPVGVVDRLERVEVEVQHREGLAMGLGTGQRLVDPFAKEGAVRQQGQAVAQGQFASTAVRGLGADEFGVRQRKCGLRLENLEFELLAPGDMVRQRGLQLVERADALQHAGADSIRGAARLRLGQRAQLAHRQREPGLDGIEEVVPIVERHVRRQLQQR